MAVQLSVAVRNARLDAVESTMGASARLQIRTGAQPANCAASSTGTLLVDMTLPADFMAAASGGTKALVGTWQASAAGSGNAGHYRIFDSSATTCHEQGTVTATGGGGDLTLDNVSISSGQPVTITAKTLTDANA